MADQAVTEAKLAFDPATHDELDAHKASSDHDLRYWRLTGNAGTTPGTNFLGTTDNQALELKVNGARALRLEPGSTPNVIGGSSGNSVSSGVIGATISGGGMTGAPNTVISGFGTVGGGQGNTSGADGTVGGGQGNTSGPSATVGGGQGNTASGSQATVGGGDSNTASGAEATVGGGEANTASGVRATVPGGAFNTAGGDYSFAAGRRAEAILAGNFAWADSNDVDFSSGAFTNAFLVRSTGGAQFVSAINVFGGSTAGVSLAPGGNSWSAISDRA